MADAQTCFLKLNPTLSPLVDLVGIRRIAPSCRPGQGRPVGEPRNPRRPLLGFPRGESVAGKTRTLRRRSCSDRVARSPSYRFSALPLAVGLACGRFYRRPACAPGRLGRPSTVLPGSTPDLARCIFLQKIPLLFVSDL
jgi:hypothetical protein